MDKEGNAPRRKRVLEADDFVKGVLENNRAILAQTITLVESNAEKHFYLAQKVISELLPYTGKSIRIGITGVPGAGKSTLIEAFGSYLCDLGHRVAVLAVDPSSQISKGSILGDKTRMEQLGRNKNAFVRPTPAGGTLGGVARKSRETMLVCEAAGYDVIIVETVGVGQSEITVRSMVDLFIVLMLTGAGDELQGMKKGILELADAIFINKADGNNKLKALTTKEEYNQILHYIPPATKGWETKAYTCSALNGEGIDTIWDVVGNYVEHTKRNDTFYVRRQEQLFLWLRETLQSQLLNRFYDHPNIKNTLPDYKQQIEEGRMTVTIAAQKLLEEYDKHK
ncbi:methylmalonyl Co-A mutase-associated GTPase MeaB [Anaerobacillus isosaccharinicus]|uniref:ATPase/protein kinase n=1 Tax=Anaerobacillus isosaccharinicus TaxID=1532552 RepID=A0A1S2LFQ4_9BACI|nr:methylmalonyl Co-A mutase-associated GTPase MeaB [Anaerobacillus isosaccharinicus]MBA5587758.1 methylmalonyl Co-A mutase-associated GTPase MeaB [Anaerobacillus isosaccharinicus]QOY34082.1 methylmalonyl Co-A mutase-associated GTPase MeaB [Anaerobacillus isosaccharinicus]